MAVSLYALITVINDISFLEFAFIVNKINMILRDQKTQT